MYKSIVITALLFTTGLYAQAQSKQERAYQEEADQVKKEIQDVKDPAFAQTTVPEKYQNESAVILALKFSLDADHSRRKDHITMTLHERVKIQDKAALEEYSEFNIQKLKSSSWARGYKLVSFMGIRVIKPSGQQRDIDMNDAVSVKDEKNDKKQKIAIADLQVGDIIDYYVQINKDAANWFTNPDPLDYSIGEKYPMLDFSLDIRIFKKMGVSWRYLNDDSTALKRSKEDEDYVFAIHKKDVPKITDERWLYPNRSLPTLRLTYNGARDIVNGVNEKDIQQYLTYQIISVGPQYAAMPGILKEFGKVLDNYKKEHDKKDMTKQEITDLAYYYIRYASLYRETPGLGADIEVGQNRKMYTPRLHFVANAFRQLLLKYDIETDLAAAVPRHIGTLQDAVSLDDLEYFIIAKPDDQKVICYISSMFSYPDELPTSLEGQEAYTVSVTGSKSEKEASFKKIILPMSTATQNQEAEKLNITFNADNLQQLKIDRMIMAKGQYRYQYVDMLLYEDMLSEERKTVSTKTTFEDDLSADRKRLSEYTAAFAKARKDMDETVKDNIATDYSVKPTDVTYYKIAEQGLEKQNKPFTMHQSFTMDGFVKKAGNNYMLDIGKLITGQIELTQEERKRTYDVNMAFPRTMSYELWVNIPEGYMLEGAESLNKSVINAAGQFVSSTKMEGNKLVLKISKSYNHPHEAVATWDQMMAFMDAAADFTKQKVLLKKI
ncbi:DUF3857 domain-containing protein [Chitinophaga sancti]|uniref:DUF3857 domain-containing protein n=1 Tax=Chitinophaga sancti TaxID=1004 RepID=UPI003F7A6011